MKTALSESEHNRQGLFQELAKVKKQASQVDCVMNENTQVKHEASKWKEMMSAQSAELSKLRGEVVALRKENDDLKEEIEAQKPQVN